MRSYFSEQFADKGRPCSTRKQAYREYTAALLRIGAGGRRVGIQNRRGYATPRSGEKGEREREERERRERERARDGILRGLRHRCGTVDGGTRGRSLFYTILLYNSCLPESYWSILSVCYQREPCMPGATCPTPKVNTHPRSLSPQQHSRRSSVKPSTAEFSLVLSPSPPPPSLRRFCVSLIRS